MKLRRIKLTKYERELEQELLRGEWVPGSRAEFNEIAQALAERKKNRANPRVFSWDWVKRKLGR